MNGYIGEMIKLIVRLREAKIPFEHIVVYNPHKLMEDDIKMFGDAGKYLRNQVNYWRPDGSVAFDCVLQSGSYGCKEGLLETYHELGVDENNSPMVMTAEEAFEIIKKDWENQNA